MRTTVYLVSQPRFEPITAPIRVWNITDRPVLTAYLRYPLHLFFINFSSFHVRRSIPEVYRRDIS
jgi:hypothetical protein